jgi:hypothetical protein
VNNGQLFRIEAQQHYADSGTADSAPHVLTPSTPRLTATISALAAITAGVLAFVPVPAHRLVDAVYDPGNRSLSTCLPLTEPAEVTDVRVVLGAADPDLRLDPRSGVPAPAPGACASGRADGPHTRWERVTLPDRLPPGGVRVRVEVSSPLWCVVVAPCA